LSWQIELAKIELATVGQTIAFRGLLPRAVGPRNFMKNRQSDTMAQ